MTNLGFRICLGPAPMAKATTAKIPDGKKTRAPNKINKFEYYKSKKKL
jgi:hypothetical protein